MCKLTNMRWPLNSHTWVSPIRKRVPSWMMYGKDAITLLYLKDKKNDNWRVHSLLLICI